MKKKWRLPQAFFEQFKFNIQYRLKRDYDIATSVSVQVFVTEPTNDLQVRVSIENGISCQYDITDTNMLVQLIDPMSEAIEYILTEISERMANLV